VKTLSSEKFILKLSTPWGLTDFPTLRECGLTVEIGFPFAEPGWQSDAPLRSALKRSDEW